MLKRSLALLACFVAASGCDSRQNALAPPPNVATYEVRGVLREKLADGRKAVIAHDAIPGYMAAMAMEFDTHDPQELASLAPGDTLDFRLSVTDRRSWIDQVRKTGHVALEPAIASPVEAPTTLPDCALVDQSGQPIHLADFKGRALAFTFIYTRCPLPDFCPLMSDRFGEVQRALAAGDWHLLSISIDPQHDTPERLTDYARRYQPDPARWTFATGSADEIQKLSGLFGLAVIREGVQINHNLRTVVVDAAGRVQKIFSGNTWKTQDLIEEMKRAMPNRP